MDGPFSQQWLKLCAFKNLFQFKSPDPTSTPLKKALHVNGLDLWLAVQCAFIDKVPVLTQVYRDRNASNDPLLHLLMNCLSCLISSHLLPCKDIDT